MNHDLITFALASFTGFFAIINPFAITPVFMGLVNGKSKAKKILIAKKATITAFLIVAAFTILGKYIFQLFGITIPAFKITGGILLFYVGFEMLITRKSQIQSQEDITEDESIAISPLAIPILAGPGTIVTAMNSVTDASYFHILIVLFTLFIILLINFFSFKFSDILINKIGKNMLGVISKLMGLIIAIIGAEMLIGGLKLAFNI